MKKGLSAFIICCSLCLTACKKTDITGNTANPLNYQSVGKSANDLLSAVKYTTVNIQVLYMPGYAPDAAALNNVQLFLNALINKSSGINITMLPIAASGKNEITLTDIREIEKTNRTVFTTGSSLGLCLLYVDAKYTENNTLGLAHLNTSMVLFAKTIHDNSGGINQPSLTKLETTVMEHEFGHLLGLVDLGSPMQVNHKESSSNHCNNSNCLMYYATNVMQMGGGVLMGAIPALDNNCKNDLTANGGK